MNSRTQTNKNVTVKGTIGKSGVEVSSLIGQLLIHADSVHVPTKNYARLEKKKYTHRYPRTASTYMRTSKSVEIMRFTYKYSMNNIAFGLGISTRTVKRHIDSLYKIGYKAFSVIKNRLRRSKNSSMMRMLRRVSAQIKRYINGHLTLLELYLALGIKPPPSEDGAYSSLF